MESLFEGSPQVNPLEWGPSKILFRSTDNLDELLLVIAFIIKHNLEVLVVNQWRFIENDSLCPSANQFEHIGLRASESDLL